MQADGLQVITYSGYGFKFGGTWAEYVKLNNTAATRFIQENRFGEGHGYILTSTSYQEFADLRVPKI